MHTTITDASTVVNAFSVIPNLTPTNYFPLAYGFIPIIKTSFVWYVPGTIQHFIVERRELAMPKQGGRKIGGKNMTPASYS
jgi:hypothetical protein